MENNPDAAHGLLGGLPSFVSEVRDGLASVPLSYANSILGSKSNLYRIVWAHGWYLPKRTSKAVSCHYLFEVANGTVFRILQSDIKPFVTERRRWNKIDLITELRDNILKSPLINFDCNHLPDRKWLLNILYTCKSDHEVFTGTSFQEKQVQIPIRYH